MSVFEESVLQVGQVGDLNAAKGESYVEEAS